MKIFKHLEIKLKDSEDILEGLTDLLDIVSEDCYKFSIYTLDELDRWNKNISEWFEDSIIIVYCEDEFDEEEALEYISLAIENLISNLKLLKH